MKKPCKNLQTRSLKRARWPTHARYTAHESTSEKLIRLMEAPYEETISVADSATGRELGDNLLISYYDNRTVVDKYSNFVSVVHIRERRSYTAVEGGYDETVIVQGNRQRLREAAARALDYARERGLRVQVNNPHVEEDIAAGILDGSGLLVVDGIQNVISDRRSE